MHCILISPSLAHYLSYSPSFTLQYLLFICLLLARIYPILPHSFHTFFFYLSSFTIVYYVVTFSSALSLFTSTLVTFSPNLNPSPSLSPPRTHTHTHTRPPTPLHPSTFSYLPPVCVCVYVCVCVCVCGGPNEDLTFTIFHLKRRDVIFHLCADSGPNILMDSPHPYTHINMNTNVHTLNFSPFSHTCTITNHKSDGLLIKNKTLLFIYSNQSPLITIIFFFILFSFHRCLIVKCDVRALE